VPSYLSGGSSVTKSQSAASDSYRLKIRILGDSVVESLKDGFLKEAEKIGVDVELISISGCGFMPGATLGDDGSVYTPSLGCPKQVKNLLAQVNTNLKADLVIWFDAWDSLSREVDGEKLIVGQNDAILIALLRTTAKDFLNLGHKVIIVSTPERAHSAVLQPRGPAKTEINRYQYAIRNSIVAGDQPDDRIFTLNLNDLVCKDKSPCPDISEAGIRYRPTDGIHFEGSEVTTVAHWILSRSIALGQSGSM
jgi:hypothetical protein